MLKQFQKTFWNLKKQEFINCTKLSAEKCDNTKSLEDQVVS